MNVLHTSSQSLPKWGFAAALAQLPRMTPRRLRLLLQSRSSDEAWTLATTRGIRDAWCTDALRDEWSRADRSLPEKSVERCTNLGVSVVSINDGDFPELLRHDVSPPAVLFVKGNLSALARRRVAMVGTRSATQYGRHFARTLSRELSLNDVCVVSGLARGIDVHAHRGTSEASVLGTRWCPPVAVVASGVDVVYPPENERVWRWVEAHGAVVSEYAPGTSPLVHHFPQRNRIIAALSEIVVVVESAARGGSMITVREAMTRGVPVMAVPGAPHVRASEGTNGLLRDGCAPVTDVTDVLIALNLETGHAIMRTDTRIPPTGFDATVLDECGSEPRTIDSLVSSLNESPMSVAVALGRLQQSGWVEETAGWWEALTAR